MKQFAKFCLNPRPANPPPDTRLDMVDQELFSQLLRIYPEGNYYNSFTVQLPVGDRRLQEILSLLENKGIRPRQNRMIRTQPNEFRMRVERVYEKGDFDAAAYLIPRPDVSFGNCALRTESGLLKLETKFIKPKERIGFASWPWIVVSQELKVELEKSEGKHLAFRETVAVGPGSEKFQSQFWELTSDLILPPLSPKCVLMNNDGQPFDGDYDKGCFLVEGLYEPAEHHYAASSLKSVEPFDLGLTRERVGNKEAVAYRRLVASKRFYEFCKLHKLKMDWIPVRLDPD